MRFMLFQPLQHSFYAVFDFSHIGSRLEPRHDIAFAVDNKLREIPFDVGRFCPIRVLFGKLLFEQIFERMLAESFEALLRFQVSECYRMQSRIQLMSDQQPLNRA